MIAALGLLLAWQDAQAYLDKALDILEKNSINRDTDWAKMRSVALEKAKVAKTPSETYPAILAALDVIHNKHTFFVPPERAKQMLQGKMRGAGYICTDRWVCLVLPGSPAERAGVKVGWRVEAVDGKPVATDGELRSTEREIASGTREDYKVTLSSKGSRKDVTIRPEVTNFNLDPFGRSLPGGIGYVFIPAFSGSPQQSQHYADVLSGLIQKMDKTGVKGWVVDLRLDGGGNMYPMLAGLSPILDVGTLGYFVAKESRSPWGVRNGASFEGDEIVTKVSKPYRCKNLKLPIAVLIDSKCASSGEITAIAFLGMRNAKLFGMPSAGFTSANQVFALDDGAQLVVTVSWDADRSGNLITDFVKPDVRVQTNWEHFGTSRDEGIQAARRWIESDRM